MSGYIPTGGCDVEAGLAGLASRLLRFRQHRNRILGTDIFNEPAWEIQLALISNDGSKSGTSLDELSCKVDCPYVLIERWINILYDRGFVEKRSMNQEIRYFVTSTGREKFREIVTPYLISGV